MAEEQKTCFIAMPISTPEHFLPVYGNDSDHFRHVLEFLFEPAVAEAGLKPIRPISEGSEVIHSDIVGHLQTADLVLVDMSTLNANAFFEFGIRTSLNKPVCLVRDDKTKVIPFDASLLNTATYDSRLDPWFLKEEVPKLAKHIQATIARSGDQNPLWKHFGFKIEAKPAHAPVTPEDKLDLLLNEMSSLRAAAQQSRVSGQTESVRVWAPGMEQDSAYISDRITQVALRVGVKVEDWTVDYPRKLVSITIEDCPDDGRRLFVSMVRHALQHFQVSVKKSS